MVALIFPAFTLLLGVTLVNGFVLRSPVSKYPPRSNYQHHKHGPGVVISHTITATGTNLCMSSSQPSSRNNGDSSSTKNSKRRGKKNYFKFIKDTRVKSQNSAVEVNSASSEAMSMTSPYSNTKPLHKALRNILAKILNVDEVGKWRAAAATFITSIAVFSPKIDLALIRFWSWLQNDTTAFLPRAFRHDHWEWVVAITAFFFWIHGYWLVDRSIAKSDARGGQVHPWKKYRLQDEYEAEKLRRKQLRTTNLEAVTTTIHGGNGDVTVVSDMDQHKYHQHQTPPPTKQQKWHTGFWLFELPLYVLPLYIWDITIPRRAAKIVSWGAPTAFGICKDVSCGLLLYDLGFFFCHYLMHKIPFIYKYVHAKHHTSKEVRASDIVRLSFVEEIVDVGISILALNYLGAHPMSRTIYNVIITFLLTELHCGYAFPWTPQFVVPFGLATGSKGHHYHHRNGRHYYQKFFCHVDRLFGFVQKKDDSLQGASI